MINNTATLCPRPTDWKHCMASREGQHSIRINDQWRICFVWKGGGAHDVEIVDYH